MHNCFVHGYSNRLLFPNFGFAVATAFIVAVLPCLGISLSHAAAPAEGVITPNIERQGLPQFRPEAPLPMDRPRNALPGSETAIPDLVLPSAIGRIDLKTPQPATEVDALLQPYLGRNRISGRELEETRGAIWEFYRRHGRMTRVELQAIPNDETNGGSILQVRIHEVRVRAVRVEQQGSQPVDQALLEQIIIDAKADVAEGGALDLDRLESRIKRREFVGDLDVRATLVPVATDSVDVKILVSWRKPLPIAFLAQVDNYGLKTFGRIRYTAGLSIPGRIRAGDKVDIIGIKTEGLNYARLGYETPLADIGARASAWGSYTDYQAPTGINGESSQIGAGLSYPLHYGRSSVLIGHLNFVNRNQVDRLGGTSTLIGDKSINNIQARVDANFLLGPVRSLHFDAVLTHGNLDLSSLPAVQAQDSLSARTNGQFNKLEWNTSWSTLAGMDGRYDFRLGAKGQFASKNLDQSEKFALGGPNGVRGYGPAEALGDDGTILDVEAGYRLRDGLRLYTFYDVGRIRRHHQPWAAEVIPVNYTLQAAGVGLNFAYKALIGSLTYARQIGANPGVSAAGLDSEGSTARQRLWLSMTLWL